MTPSIAPRGVALLCQDNPAAKALERLLRDWGYEGVRGCEPNELAVRLVAYASDARLRGD